MLQKAKRPLFLAGGGVKYRRAQESVPRGGEKTQVPVVTTVMGRGAIPQSTRCLSEILVCTALMRQIWQ
jgi:thiamine pyrophosphate-dependent acetolactate synthase large subunit-like protein